LNEDILKYTEQYIKKIDIQGKSVLEVGSLNVNGSVRPYIESLRPKSYLGIDIKDGNGVDSITDITKCNNWDVLFDVIICQSTLEHIRQWRKAVNNMKELLVPGGLIYISVPDKEFHFHAYPCDWWRFSQADLQIIFSDFETIRNDKIKMTTLFIGRKIDDSINDILNYKVYSILRNKLMKNQLYLDLAIWSFKNWKHLLRKILVAIKNKIGF